jgi:hypothetical protein
MPVTKDTVPDLLKVPYFQLSLCLLPIGYRYRYQNKVFYVLKSKWLVELYSTGIND